MSKKKKPPTPSWAKCKPTVTGGTSRPSTPATRAAEELHRAIEALLVAPGLDRLGEYDPIELELEDEGGEVRRVHAAAAHVEEYEQPCGLIIATGPSSFAQLAAEYWGALVSGDGRDDEGRPLELRDAELVRIDFGALRTLSPSARRAQIGAPLELGGIPRALTASYMTHRRAGLMPDVEDLQAATAVVRALTRALAEPTFQARPYDLERRLLTRVAMDGSRSEVPWPELDEEVRDVLDPKQNVPDPWTTVERATLATLERRACALADEEHLREGPGLVITWARRSDSEDDRRIDFLFLEADSLREVARCVPRGRSATSAGASLAAFIGELLEVLEGGAVGGPNSWNGGAPSRVIVELPDLDLPLHDLLSRARAAAGLRAVDVVFSEADSAAARYRLALGRIEAALAPADLDEDVLAGAHAFIEHRSEHFERGWEAELLAFLADEATEAELMNGGVAEGRIAGARSYRLLRAVARCAGAEPWLPPLLGTDVLPEALVPGLEAWAEAAPDFYVREPNGETFRALGAGTTGLRVSKDVLDDLPDFDAEAQAVPLWCAVLGACEAFAPAGRPMPRAAAQDVLESIRLEHGTTDVTARRAAAAQLVRRTFV